MNIRIQTYGMRDTNMHAARAHTSLANARSADDVSVYDVLEKGFKDLEDVCDVMLGKFRSAKQEYGKHEEMVT